MKVILHTNIDSSHLDMLFKNLRTLELKPNSLSTLQIKYPKEILEYNIWHNKKSFSVSSVRYDTK